jgi:hypothetical protein
VSDPAGEDRFWLISAVATVMGIAKGAGADRIGLVKIND